MRFICCVLLLSVQFAAPAREVTFEKLLREMVDLERLTTLPDPAYTCRQFSSYDQRSTDPAQATDENWFANSDRGQYLRVEEREGRQEYVLMDARGPGAIVRIWSANPADAGICRIYLDNAAAPAVELPLEELLGGNAPGFPAPIASTQARGWNSYLPIPYATHCKVTASKPDFYYHINYRTYEPGTGVRTYSKQEAARAKALLEEIAGELAHAAAAGDYDARLGDRTRYTLTLGPGESGVVVGPEGSKEVASLTAKLQADDMDAALRGCLIELFFDDDKTPAVQAPLGDFFGTAPGINPYEALPCGVLEDGTLYSHWRMPYRHGCVMRMTNYTAKPVTVEGRLEAGPRRWTRDSLYFHAKWRSAVDIPTQPRQDWTFLSATGAGRFVGVALHIVNPVPAWWGEGDEKIYVDSERFPSHFGTGSEDYFGYAWCDTARFSHAYHNQVRCDGPGNFGNTTLNRFHLIDDIPFTSAFKFDLEVWHWADTKVTQGAMAYWYARPGASDDFTPPAPASLVLPALPAEPVAKRVEGALEGEKLEVVASTGGAPGTQQSFAWPWSGAEQLWWIDAKPGDTLDTAISVAETGKYDVRAVFTKGPDYGIAQVYVDGVALGTSRDFYSADVSVTPEESLGLIPLSAGRHIVRVEIMGCNANALPRHMVGLDYLLLKPAN